MNSQMLKLKELRILSGTEIIFKLDKDCLYSHRSKEKMIIIFIILPKDTSCMSDQDFCPKNLHGFLDREHSIYQRNVEFIVQ